MGIMITKGCFAKRIPNLDWKEKQNKKTLNQD